MHQPQFNVNIIILGLPLGLGAPVMTPNGVIFLFLSFYVNAN